MNRLFEVKFSKTQLSYVFSLNFKRRPNITVNYDSTLLVKAIILVMSYEMFYLTVKSIL